MRYTNIRTSPFFSFVRVGSIAAVFAVAAITVTAQCAKPGLNLLTPIFVPTNYFTTDLRDINGDGKIDVVFYIIQDSGQVGVSLGDGTGSFGPVIITPMQLGGSNADPVFGDLTGDGKPELMMDHTTGSTLDVFLNNLDGRFNFAYSIPHTGELIGTADFDNDGDDDLLSLANEDEGGPAKFFTIRLGDGGGSYSELQHYQITTPPVSQKLKVFIGDFNGDGFKDVAAGVLNGDPALKVKIFLNDGTGLLFDTPATGITIADPVAVTDLNGDGLSDVIGRLNNSHTLMVSLNQGSNAFTSVNYPERSAPSGVRVVDFDGNGAKDLMVFYPGSDIYLYPGGTLMLNDGQGHLTPYELRKPSAGIAADVNGDGKTDFLDNALHNRWTKENVITLRQPTCSGKNDARSIDFDGDGTTEYAVWRPSNGTWYQRLANSANAAPVQFGANGDIPAAGDYDGDGKTDLTVFRPSTGVWYQYRSSDQSVLGLQFGAGSDKPVPADFDGDGITDIAVYRPSEGAWYMVRSSSNTFYGIQFGISSDTPVPSDFDGDGQAEIAVFRASEGYWFMLRSSDGAFAAQPWGTIGDLAVPADYDGDGKADFTVYRPSNRVWYALRSYNGTVLFAQWGANGDIPLPGYAAGMSYATSVFARPAFWRPSDGGFYLHPSMVNPVKLGVTGDRPVVSPYPAGQ